MFVRVNKPNAPGIPDDNGAKGGWWTVEPGVHDEGRPGRKSRTRKSKGEGSMSSIPEGAWQAEEGEGLGLGLVNDDDVMME